MSNNYQKILCKIVYDLTNDTVFTSIGLELSSMNILLENNDTFILKDLTFGYYNYSDNSIHINIQDQFFTTCKDISHVQSRLMFILIHEVCHKLFLHIERSNNRQKMAWNIATDYEVHNLIYTMVTAVERTAEDSIYNNAKYIQYMMQCIANNNNLDFPPFLFDKKYLPNISEQIYQMLLNDGQEISNTEQFVKFDNCDDTVQVNSTTYKLPNGTQFNSVNIDWSNEVQSDDQQSANRTEINRSLLQSQLNNNCTKGDCTSPVNIFLKKLFHVKVDWQKVLRNSLQTIAAKSQYFCWNSIRTSTLLLNNMSYLPDIVQQPHKYGKLIIAIDESGSINNDNVCKAGQIVMEANDLYDSIIVIKHDTKITSIKQFDQIDQSVIDYLVTRSSYGGTSHKCVFEYINQYIKDHSDVQISCFIGITDMASDIEHYQHILNQSVPVVWLVPPDSLQYYKDVVIGKVIPVE